MRRARYEIEGDFPDEAAAQTNKMLIFWKERLVFLSTPKAGSTAVQTALESLAQVAVRRPPELKHMPAAAFARHYRPYLEAQAGGRFTTVALMREPIDWLGSWYRFRQRDDVTDPARATHGMSFDEAAQAYLETPESPRMGVGTQSSFLCDQGGEVAVDRLFRYEAMETFVDFLEDRLGCEIILPRVNVSTPGGAMTLGSDTEARLRQKLARDYEIYGALE